LAPVVLPRRGGEVTASALRSKAIGRSVLRMEVTSTKENYYEKSSRMRTFYCHGAGVPAILSPGLFASGTKRAILNRRPIVNG
jgi:hypothetical protein